MYKESYPRVNEGKQQSKQFIIYDLDKYFESKWQKKMWASQMQSDSRALTNWATGTADVSRQKIWLRM